jgi:hypothetical protein
LDVGEVGNQNKLGAINSFASCIPEQIAFIDQYSSLNTSFLDHNCGQGGKKEVKISWSLKRTQSE